MKNKLITIAIRHIEQAERLKQTLNKCGIQAFIHDVSDEQKGIAPGVRIRISERDLPKALLILDRLEKEQEDIVFDHPFFADEKRPAILVPIDFSDYSIKACHTAFDIADQLHVPVILLHAYISMAPIYTLNTASSVISEELRKQLVQINADMSNLTKLINTKMAAGEMPKVEFVNRMEEGIPENVIHSVVEQINPVLVVMGTRGKNQKEEELIGSVTAEVIEHCKSPVLAIPESVSLDFSKTMNVMFATNFDDRTLLSLDKMMLLLGRFNVKLLFTHFEPKKDAWNEIKLAGIRDYFKQQYPKIETSYSLISENDLLIGVDRFVNENDINILALNTHKRNWFARLFNPSMARKMVFHAQTATLVFHT